MASMRAERRWFRPVTFEPGEAQLFVLLTLLVGFLFGGYTIAKVLRDSLFLSEYGAKALPFGYIAVAIASVGLVAIESKLTGRLSRVGATALAQLMAIGASFGFALLFPLEKHWMAAAFYIWTGSQAMMLLSYFWLLALDLWDPRRAQSILPLFSGAGLLGGVVGGAFATWGVRHVGIEGLLWTLVISLAVARGVTMLLERRLPGRPFVAQAGSGTSRIEILRHSSFLRFLAATLALSVVVSTLVDFQFKSAAQQAFPDKQALTRFLGLFYAGLNGLALIVQFTAAGWFVRRAGVFLSTLPQPLTVLAFAVWVAISPVLGVIFALRWVQGVLFQTVGKSSFELYFMAIRPPEREKVKPALDTVVERLADAFAGVVLLVVLRGMGVSMRVVAALTAVVAGVWLFMLFGLQRRYVREFRHSLAQHRSDPRITGEALRLPEARRILIEALHGEDEVQVSLAIRLAVLVKHPEVVRAIESCLDHPAVAVRAAAVQALDAMGIPGHEGRVQDFLTQPDAELRRAAIGYLLARAPDPVSRARRLLADPDAEIRLLTLDTLVQRPNVASGAVTLEWIDDRIEVGTPEDLLAAAQGIALVTGVAADERLRLLIAHPLLEVRRLALRSFARRPVPGLLEAVVAMLIEPDLRAESREAVAALGNLAIPALTTLADGTLGGSARDVACEALARIGGKRAIRVLLNLVKSSDPRARYDALRSLNRIRARSASGLVPRRVAQRMWLRELADYKANLRPAYILREAPDSRIALLGASYFESADRALDRACRALACYHRPGPYRSVYQYLSNSEAKGAQARAIEYLSHILPRKLFRPLREIVEENKVEQGTEGPPTPEEVVACIGLAWRNGDDWLRACAVRAAWALPDGAPIVFEPRPTEAPLVEVELLAYHARTPEEVTAP